MVYRNPRYAIQLHHRRVALFGSKSATIDTRRRLTETQRWADNMNLTAAETAATAIIRQLPPETVERLNEWLDNALAGND